MGVEAQLAITHSQLYPPSFIYYIPSSPLVVYPCPLLWGKPKICPITGLAAKYKDPKTGTPYANLQAFRILRERFLNEEAHKCDARISELASILEQKKQKKDMLSKRGAVLHNELPQNTENVNIIL